MDWQEPQEPLKNIPTSISQQAHDQIPTNAEPILVAPPRETSALALNPLRSSPPFNEERSLYMHSKVEETKFLNNDISSLSSNPSVCVQNYQSLQDSMANVNRRIFGEVTAFRPKDNKDTSNLLVESRIIDNNRTFINHVFEEESRLPLFLRKVRQHISVYPNLHILSNSPNTPEAVSEEFRLLLAEFKEALHFLSSVCQKILDSKSKKQLYME